MHFLSLSLILHPDRDRAPVGQLPTHATHLRQRTSFHFGLMVIGKEKGFQI